MIIDPDTVVNPRTVVVKALDASVADLAVLASRRSNRLAVWTQLRVVNVIEQVLEFNIVVS